MVGTISAHKFGRHPTLINGTTMAPGTVSGRLRRHINDMVLTTFRQNRATAN